MKTPLPEAITTTEEAIAFLRELHANGESFHPEDDAHDIIWTPDPAPTVDECHHLNKLMTMIYALGTFDPCAVLLDLDKRFIVDDYECTLEEIRAANPPEEIEGIESMDIDEERFFGMGISVKRIS